MPAPTPQERTRFLNAARARRHAWHCFEQSSRRTALRIAHSPQPERTLMTRQATALPLDPARLADLLLAPAADANTIHQQLADQVGPRPARQLLAAAHSIAAERLDAEVGIHYDGCTSAEGASDDPSDHYGQ